MSSIADIRKNYSHKKLSEKKAENDPIRQFRKWWKQALKADILEPNAMTLATSGIDGVPSARIVLLKGFDEKGFVFYTNYQSFKGKQLAENPKACLVFFWKEVERQVRITGIVNRVEGQQSDDYFHSRPLDSRISASISPQSEVVSDRKWLESQFKAKKKESGKEGPARPDNWGGFLVRPVIVEFWQGGPGRLHDRLQYSLQENGSWKMERLAP
jgi:pyridoxamine 5'-phosphate oxidase